MHHPPASDQAHRYLQVLLQALSVRLQRAQQRALVPGQGRCATTFLNITRSLEIWTGAVDRPCFVLLLLLLRMADRGSSSSGSTPPNLLHLNRL